MAMTQPQRARVASLTDEQKTRLRQALSWPETTPLEDAESEAFLVMALARHNDPVARSTIESVTGKAIHVHVPKDPKIPPKRKPIVVTTKSDAAKRTEIIVVVATKNPKRPGSDSATRFDRYRTGMTVQDYLDRGGRMADIPWDVSRGYIRLEAAPNPESSSSFSKDDEILAA